MAVPKQTQQAKDPQPRVGRRGAATAGGAGSGGAGAVPVGRRGAAAGGGAGRGHVALSGAAPLSFWLDDPKRPQALPALAADVRCDLAVVGGGYSGLWTALLAKERDPGRDVVLVEGSRVGWAASGRNGGFCAASLTHGLANGIDRFPDELRTLNR